MKTLLLIAVILQFLQLMVLFRILNSMSYTSLRKLERTYKSMFRKLARAHRLLRRKKFDFYSVSG